MKHRNCKKGKEICNIKQNLNNKCYIIWEHDKIYCPYYKKGLVKYINK